MSPITMTSSEVVKPRPFVAFDQVILNDIHNFRANQVTTYEITDDPIYYDCAKPFGNTVIGIACAL